MGRFGDNIPIQYLGSYFVSGYLDIRVSTVVCRASRLDHHSSMAMVMACPPCSGVGLIEPALEIVRNYVKFTEHHVSTTRLVTRDYL